MGHHVHQRMRIGQAREVELEAELTRALRYGPFTRAAGVTKGLKKEGYYQFRCELAGARSPLVEYPLWWRSLGLHRKQTSLLTTTYVPLGFAFVWALICLFCTVEVLEPASARALFTHCLAWAARFVSGVLLVCILAVGVASLYRWVCGLLKRRSTQVGS